MEEFKPVKEFPKYLVSAEGFVINSDSGHVMEGSVKRTGYKEVIFTDTDGRQYSRLLHRVVAEAFCKQELGKEEVNHINGDKLDNRAENLEWVTHGDNLKHAYETGLMPNDATPKAVTATNIETGEQMDFPSIYKAARFFNISQGNICMCCKGFRPYAGGYYWEYQEEKR